MTPEQVRKWVEEIRSMADDYEAAHSEEDRLHQSVLQSIADGKCDDPQECATAALEAGKIEFSRHCA